MNINEYLKKHQHLTRGELAKKLNLSPNAIAKREQNLGLSRMKKVEVTAKPVKVLPSDVAQLKEQLQRALRQRDEAKNKILSYAKALREAVFDAVQELKLHPPLQRRFETKKKSWSDRQEEICVIDASDWQLGKVTPTYNSDICAKRIAYFGETIVKLARVQNEHHPVRKCHLRLLGDLVEGEGIFPTQAHVIDSSLYRQVGVNGPRILSQLILDLLSYFDSVHVSGVIGNHGQVRLANGASNPETNMDRLLYQIVKLVLKDEPRVTWDIPEGSGERNWYTVDRVFDWGFLLAHGDQIRGGFAGFPFYGTYKKAFGWIDAIAEPWDYLHIGHWHTPTMQTLNRREMRCNGSTESDNTYAQEQLASVGYPSQWVGFVHPKYGITSEYKVNLEPRIPNSKRYGLQN